MVSRPLSSPTSRRAAPDLTKLRRDDGKPVQWTVSEGKTAYGDAVSHMEARAAAIAAGEADEQVWLVEHPPLYTAGVSARDEDLIDAGRFPVHRTGRGGQFTYHGPGQRVAYAMLDLNRRGRDIAAYVRGLETWIIGALDRFGVEAEARPGRVGVWVTRAGPGWSREDKIAAIGVKVRKWVSFHGIAVNVEPNLSHFGGIVPCGIREHGVTSLVDLGVTATMDEADAALKAAFEDVFGATV